jgi:GNAT superfamily N-acetyltransferase
MSATSTRVIEVPQARLGEAARMLARAFADDPQMRYLFAGQDDYAERLREFFRYNCEVHARMGWPVLAAVPRTRLAGVVAVATPDEREWPAELNDMYARFTARLGKQAAGRIERYASRTNNQFPDAPLFYVGMIGVRPESQGRGYARLLLDEVHRRSAAHPTSTGVALDTENRDNVPLYESFGYRAVAGVRLGDFTIWCMFRPNDAPPA